ncbi:hypothetical protein CB0940_06188 [Cercospora beticola]|uniref:Uncharacterized protein n=1 Tax=Cercospora beticola TaxID=122368 RepID=A0A2G5HY92_CERBT|nr:hypothetical protein CB0940_06188 [Cercospora beticola]PIA97253.1 hypothetical protein CB0940_06188 [Cercospora beticola]WPA98804.1 hypothetical protein RHO25_003417 [Cercospora beticola]
MQKSTLTASLFSCLLPWALADFIDIPTYPTPRKLSSEDSLEPGAWKNFSSILDAHLQQNTSNGDATDYLAGLENVTFSVGLFSLHDPEATTHQYHYTSPQIAESEFGTKQVDADSIYRVASVSKLITVYTGLLELSEEDWDRPLTEYFPSLKNVTAKTRLQSAPGWNIITPRALSSHMSGISATGIIADSLLSLIGVAVAQNASLSGSDLQAAVDALAIASGLPPLPIESLGSCALLGCNNSLDEFVDSFKPYPPVFQPWTTPAYSNLGMFILGQVILNVTGRSYTDYESLYGEAVFDHLNMSSTFVNAPAASDASFNRSVIAGPVPNNWEFPLNGPTIPSGGILSTLNDLNKLGVGILNHTLLSAEATRAWMKPVTHSASLSYSIGAPWEIVRYLSPSSGKVIDIYTKLGDSGSYSAMLAFIPEYNVGFSYLSGYFVAPGTDGRLRDKTAFGIINTLVETLMPALEAQAASEAEANFVGTYSAGESDNSTLVIAQRTETNVTSGEGAGLYIEHWTSNGVDALPIFAGQVPRLLPAMQQAGASPDEVTFQVSLSPQWSTYAAAGLGPFTGFYDSNFAWLLFDSADAGGRYGGQGIGTFVFELDERGRAVAVTNAATGARMERAA